ncbi:hypothetical protein [Rhodanobacter sp. MP1X3]|uniref:hypothetical protein n=1 Tax=Rhodanobacter sp. MP1X3 TaxID=2723086 RepID=UPI00161E4093|nr:hypothetical protein [Rhodanobacter sp. MP1X3]MBB6241975.1 hypothetical protein [Rhodanobacter sp. MP1X3]
MNDEKPSRTPDYTQADYDHALANVAKQKQIRSDATAKEGTSHLDNYNVPINIAKEDLKKVRDAMVAAGTLPPDTPEVVMEMHSSQYNDTWSGRRDE